MRRPERGIAPAREPDYHELKQRWTDAVAVLARALPKMSPLLRTEIKFDWCEANRKRDPDNVSAGGRKMVLDGLVVAKVLASDGARHVGNMHDYFWYPDTGLFNEPGVRVVLWDGRADRKTAELWVPGPLPDLNALLHAQERGALRGARFRARTAGSAPAPVNGAVRR